MATWTFYLAGGVLIFLILARIPGFSTLMLPIVIMAGKLLGDVMSGALSWSTYLVRIVWRAHMDVLNHLAHDEEHFDLQLRLKRKVERQ